MIEYRKKPVLILLTAIVFLLCYSNDIYISSLPRMVVDFNTSPNVINLTLSLYIIGTAFFLLFADVVSSRFGRRPIIIVVSSLVLKDSMEEREQIRALGIMMTGIVFSPAIAPVVGAYLAHHFTWRSCFIFSAVVGAILVVASFKILPETIKLKITKLPPLGGYLRGICLS